MHLRPKEIEISQAHPSAGLNGRGKSNIWTLPNSSQIA